MGLVLYIGSDYPLKGSITYFESYMFVTTAKHISDHTSFDEEIVFVDGKRSSNVVSMLQLNDRKKALTLFNTTVKQYVPSIPKPTGLSCCMVDIVDDSDEYDEDEVNSAYQFIKEEFIRWMTNNNRVGVMVQHFYQNNRCPHVHILYQRAKGKHDEFKDYLESKLDEE